MAGYRLGLVIVAIPLVLGGGLLTWWLARGSRAAVTWAIAAGVLALTITAVLGARAPESRGAVSARMDALDLPFFEMRSERQSGHSWCRPTCPTVERQYTVPDVGVQSTMLTVGLALAEADLVSASELRSIGQDTFLRVPGDRIDLEVRVDEADDHTIQGVRLRFRSHRPD